MQTPFRVLLRLQKVLQSTTDSLALHTGEEPVTCPAPC